VEGGASSGSDALVERGEILKGVSPMVPGCLSRRPGITCGNSGADLAAVVFSPGVPAQDGHHRPFLV
jgi:hypothetical protein